MVRRVDPNMQSNYEFGQGRIKSELGLNRPLSNESIDETDIILLLPQPFIFARELRRSSFIRSTH